MNIRTFARLALLVVLLAGCQPTGPTPSASGSPYPTPAPVRDPRLASAHAQVNRDLVAANTRFAFKLFAALPHDARPQNVMISPASVALALAMTYNGAAGETRQAMAQALEVQAFDRDALNRDYALLRLTLASPQPDSELVIANSLWGRAGVPFKPDFLQRNRDDYGATVGSLDFNDPLAAARIDEWVRSQTRGRIDKVAPSPIDPQTILFLINAIYFKAAWTEQFDPARTQSGDFHLADGQVKQVPLMHGTLEQSAYLRGNGFQAVRLPYGSDGYGTPAPADLPPYQPGRLSMYVFVPDGDLSAFAAQLNADNWSKWTAGFTPEPIALTLPRFRYSYETELQKPLSALGMGVAFDPGSADFSDLADLAQLGGNAYISSVKHKTFVDVNEDGTEAAAVTVVTVGTTSAGPEPVVVTVDRPFFYAIADTVTGEVLFMGTVVEP
jgi:serine protease inhibitor